MVLLIYTERWDATKVNEPRTRTTIEQCQGSQSKVCVHPLLNFEVNDIVIDELHLMLRVTDILLRNLIWAMLHMDMRDNGETHLKALVDEIRSCGISFKVINTFHEYTHVCTCH